MKSHSITIKPPFSPDSAWRLLTDNDYRQPRFPERPILSLDACAKFPQALKARAPLGGHGDTSSSFPSGDMFTIFNHHFYWEHHHETMVTCGNYRMVTCGNYRTIHQATGKLRKF